MLSTKVNTSFAMALFALAVTVLGFLSLGIIPIIFFTTKPFAFLKEWQLLSFVGLTAVSFSLIPFAASRSQPWRHIWLLVAWVGANILSGMVLSVVTSTLHRLTLSIPDWLFYMGLFGMPIVSGVTIIMPRLWRLTNGAARQTGVIKCCDRVSAGH